MELYGGIQEIGITRNAIVLRIPLSRFSNKIFLGTLGVQGLLSRIVYRVECLGPTLRNFHLGTPIPHNDISIRISHKIPLSTSLQPESGS